MILFVAFDGLADDGQDVRYEMLLRLFSRADPELILFELEGEPDLLPSAVQHSSYRLVWKVIVGVADSGKGVLRDAVVDYRLVYLRETPVCRKAASWPAEIFWNSWLAWVVPSRH